MPKQSFLSLRIFARQREQKIVTLGVQRNILHSHVDTIFPEYSKIFLKLESKSSLYVLDNYSAPQRIIKLGLTRLIVGLRKVSRGKLADNRAKELMGAARESIGMKDGTDAVIYAIRSAVKSIRKIQQEILEIEKLLIDSLNKIPYSDKLLSIGGMGPVSLSMILGEMGDISRYQTAKEPMKLAGLNLYKISSGQQKGRRKISKRGRPLLRKTLFFATLRMVKSSGIFREDYLRLTEQNNMQKTKALVALSRKLIRVMFALVRNGETFQQQDQKLAAAA